MGFLEDIATQLNTVGIGVYPGTPATRTIYIGEMPDLPDLCIALYARPGRGRQMADSGNVNICFPDLHVEVRAATYSAAQTRAEAIDAALHNLSGLIGSTQFGPILARGEPCKLEVDGRNRTIFYQNFEVSYAK